MNEWEVMANRDFLNNFGLFGKRVGDVLNVPVSWSAKLLLLATNTDGKFARRLRMASYDVQAVVRWIDGLACLDFGLLTVQPASPSSFRKHFPRRRR